jgi:hypothetical protein
LSHQIPPLPGRLRLYDDVPGREERLTAYGFDGVIENTGVLGPVSAATG